jgi:hypothetical protein
MVPDKPSQLVEPGSFLLPRQVSHYNLEAHFMADFARGNRLSTLQRFMLASSTRTHVCIPSYS